MEDVRTIGPLRRGKWSTREFDRVASELAERQHGVLARGQLLAAGFSTRAIEGRMERGVLHAVHRGIYAVGHPLLSVNGRRMAAVLACGPGAALSYRSAARLWGLRRGSESSIEVTRAKGWRAPVGILVHRATLPDDELAVVDGIPVTTVPRTVLDLATVVSRRSPSGPSTRSKCRD